MDVLSSQDLLDRAEELINVNKPDRALEYVNQALGIDPGDAHAHVLAARALMGLNQNREAVQAAATAISLAPTWASTHRVHAVAIKRLGIDSRQAIASAREGARLEPANPASYTVLAIVSADGRDIPTADWAARQAIHLRPDDAGCWIAASYVALAAKNWNAAESAALKALSIEPDNAGAINNLGAATLGAGRWNIGAVAFLDAAKTDPRSDTARGNVELIGFRYLSTVMVVFLLPLLVVAPLFLVARLTIGTWLMSKPERLRPLARRLGIRVATKPRYRRRLEKRNARILQGLLGARSAKWSALTGKHVLSTSFLATITAICGGVIVFAGAGVIVSTTTRNRVVSGLIVVCFALVVAACLSQIKRRRSMS